MNFAVPFIRNFKYLDDENIQFNINYKPKIKELDDFIAEFGSHRINLVMKSITEEDIEIIQILQRKYPEATLVVSLPFYHPNTEDILNKENILHYYNEIISNWDRFQGFLNLNVTDVFVGEEFCFYGEKISKNAKEKGKAIRAFCNICQSSWDATPSLKTFFIRPEDIDIYEGVFDTFEFYVDERSATRLTVIYEIYAKKKLWFGKLNEIVVGYEGEEDNRFIIPQFGIKRLNCEKKCSQGIKPCCHICDRIIELGSTLEKEHIIVKIDK